MYRCVGVIRSGSLWRRLYYCRRLRDRVPSSCGAVTALCCCSLRACEPLIVHWDRQLSKTATADSAVGMKAVPCLTCGTWLEHRGSHSCVKLSFLALQPTAGCADAHAAGCT